MFQEFHTRYLAKQTAMDILSKLAGFTPKDKPLELAGSAIERDPGKRRNVINQLVDQKYIESMGLGQGYFLVTGKALEKYSQDPYEGELNIGTPSKPLATWLSVEIMKQAIEDLLSNKACITDSTKGSGKVVLSTMDARTDAELFFDRHLASYLGEFAIDFTNMSVSFAECLKVPPNSLTAQNIEAELSVMYKENSKEIQRLARTNDAITVFKQQVEETGGWDAFIQLARKRIMPADLRLQ